MQEIHTGDDIDLGATLAGCFSSLDGSSVDHDGGSVDTTHSHDDTRHVLVAPRN